MAPVPVSRLARWGRVIFALEPRPPDLRLALRGTLGLMVPLLLGHAFDRPALYVVALAGFLLAFGDLVEDRGWRARLCLGSLVAALAVATGVLAGGHPLSAAIGMLVWGVALGLAPAYGDGAAAMSMPVVWLFLMLGLAAPSHDLGTAVQRGALCLAGGAWTIALAWAIRTIGREGPLTERTAQCFVLLADYLEHVLGAETGGTSPALSRTAGHGPAHETRVRAAIVEARRVAVATRGQRPAGPSTERLVALVELADQVFYLGSVHAETRRRQAAAEAGAVRGGQSHAFVAAARAIARVLARRTYGVSAPGVDAELARLRAETPAPDDERAEIHGRVASALEQALRIAVREVTPTADGLATESASERRRGLRERVVTPLRSCLDRRSVVGRHALRYGLVTAVAIAIDKSFAVPFGYWIALTVTVILKPYTGLTVTRAGQRIASTIAGVTVGAVLLQLSTAGAWRIAVTAAGEFATLALLLVNYGVAIFFFSIGIVPLEGLVGAAASERLGMIRVANTLIGGALALAGGYLLWPSFERRGLPTLMSAAISSMSVYADRVLAVLADDRPAPELVEAARRRAGLDHNNLHASFQRVVAEPGEHRARLEAGLVTVVTLQRLIVSLNALREMAGTIPPGRPEWTRLRQLVGSAFADLPAALGSRTRPAPMPESASEALAIARRLAAGATPHAEIIGAEIERVVWEVTALRSAVGRMV